MDDKNIKTILLVEDEVIIAMSEKMILENYGYKVITAISGEKAIIAVKSNPEIQLILMDIDLGEGIDGTEAAGIILQEYELPVVFLSSHTEPAVVEKTENITSYGYVVKSSSITVLDASIKMAFKLFEAKLNERKKEEFLREAYLYNNQIIQSAQEGIIVYDTDLRYQVWNPFMEKLSGFTAGQVLGKHPLDVFPFLKDTGVIERLERALRGEEVDSVDFHFDVPETMKDGWNIDTSASLRNLKGDIIGVIGMVNDITERKKIEDKVREKDIEFRKLSANVPELIFQFTRRADGSYCVPIASEGIKNIFGCTPEDVVDDFTAIANVIYPEDAARVIADIEYSAKHLTYFTCEFRVQIPGRDVQWIYSRSAPEKLADGSITWYGFNADITERKLAEEASRGSEELFRTLATLAPVGIYLTDPAGNCQYANPAWCKMAGMSLDEALGNGWRNGLHPDDRDMVFANWNNMVESQGQWGHEYRFISKDGKITWVYGLAASQKDSSGKITKYVGVNQDITERKLAERELIESEVKYRSLIECSSDAIFCVNKDGEYKFTNHLFASTFGQTPDYFTGKTFWDIYPKDHADYRYETTKRVISTGESESIEVEVPLPDKTLYFYATANPIMDESGKVILVLTHAVNITQRKLAEMEVKRQLTEKSILLKEVHHRIKNNIASIENLLSFQLESSVSSETINALQDAIGRVSSMRILYDKLLISEDYEDISVKNYIESLVEAVIDLFPDSIKIEIRNNLDDFTLDSKKLFPLGIIINELLTNAMKYAFNNKKTGLINISLSYVENTVTLIVNDNGSGVPEDFTIADSKGFGLMLVKMLSEQLGGDFTIENYNGTRNILKFNV